MKRIQHIILSALFVIFSSGCINNDLDSNTVSKFEDLNISSDFNWETSHEVEFLITADYSTVINITSEDGKIQYYKGFYSELPNVYNVKVNIPTFVKKVLVNGISASVVGNSVQVSLSTPNLYTVRVRSAQAFPTSDLIAAWHFDENTANTANDELGIHNGTISGATWGTGISGSALEFNGSSSKVLFPNKTTFNPVGEKISFSFWFKLSEVGASGAFIYQNVKYIIRMDAQGRVSFALYTPVWKSIVMNYADRILNTDWHHVVATYDGMTMKLYIDGVMKASDANTGAIQSSTSDVYIGEQGSINHFKGLIDEMMVYSTTLTETEIDQIYSTTPNTASGSEKLISSWEFDENSGNVAIDKQGINNGAIIDGIWGTGINGSCVNFNGTSSNVSIPNNTTLNPADAITMMAWVKTNENKTAKIFEKGDWDGHSIGMDKWLGWQASIRMEDNSSNTLVWGGGLPILNEWYHLALTYDGSTQKIYVNGQLKNSKAVTGKLKVNARDLSIGSDNASQKFFNGSIDDVKIYGSALDQTEIQTNFNSRKVAASDNDGDGVPDVDDSYPNDPARAFNNYYPADGFGSLAFEDLWPDKGDYDFNDLVVDYRFTIITNSANKVTDVLSKFVVRAIGAEFANGFGFQLPGIALKSSDIQVEGSRIFDNYINLRSNGIEDNQDKITIIVFDNVNKIMSAPSGFGVNVTPGAPYVKPDTIVINMGFTPDVYSINDLELNKFNPFLIVNEDRGKEIHLPNYLPTSLVTQSNFGTSQDDSDPSTGKYYKTEDNLPWAINVASSYDYTIEKVMVTNAYLKFSDWAESSGVQFADWYLKNLDYRDESKIYSIP